MKTLITLISTLAVSAPAFAGAPWVQTPFWQTTYNPNLSISVQNIPEELVSDCKDFDQMALDSQNIEASDMESLRSMPLPSDMAHTSFEVDLKLAAPYTMEFGIDDVLKDASTEKAKFDTLPAFTQIPQTLVLKEGYLGLPLTLASNPKSLTAKSLRLGLTPLPSALSGRPDGVYLSIPSKDVACDLIAGRASLTVKAKGTVKISLESQLKLNAFYAKVEELTRNDLQRSKKSQIRAALLGFHLGDYIKEQNGNTPEKTENQLVAILTQFFDLDSFEPNNYWTDAFGKKVLSVPGSSPLVDINVQIKK